MFVLVLFVIEESGKKPNVYSKNEFGTEYTEIPFRNNNKLKFSNLKK
jgi:hypothetical protein